MPSDSFEVREDVKELMRRRVSAKIAEDEVNLRRMYGGSILAIDLRTSALVGFGKNIPTARAAAVRRGYTPSELVLGAVWELAQEGRYYFGREGRA